MIVFTKDNGIQIPNYDDLENKPKINGVTLEGDLTSEELGIIGGGSADLSDYYTKAQSDDRFQPKGDYLTSVPSEYITETELNDAIANLDATIPYVVVKIEAGVGSVIAGNIVDVRDAKSNNKPCLAYVYNLDEAYGMVGSFHLCSIQSINPTTAITNLIYHTELGTTHKTVLLSVSGSGRVTITTDEHNYTTSDELNTAIQTRQTKLVSGMNIKTINGNSILGSGNIEIVTDLTGYATEQWVENKGYLTSVPSEYVTETELNDAIAGLGGSDIPYVCILLNQNGIKEYAGDLQAVIEAVKNKTPYLAYARTVEDLNDYGTDLGPSRTTIPLTATYNNNEGSSGYKTGNFGYHTEIADNDLYPHLDVKINFQYDSSTDSYILTGISKVIHKYLTSGYYNEYLGPAKQDRLVSGTNIKTINGNSILGSGDLTIEGGSGGTNIPVLVLDLPRDTTTGAITGEVTIKSGNLNDITNAYVNNTPYLIYAQTELDTYAIPTDVFATDGLLTLTVISQGMDGSSSLKCWYYIQDNYDGTYFGQYTPYGQLATTDYVDMQIGNINTVLENIIG